MSASDPETLQVPVAVVRRRTRWRRRRWALAAVVVVLAVVAVLATQPFTSPSAPASEVSDNGAPTSTTTVARQDLTSQTEVSATLGYAGSYDLVNQAQGTVTSLPGVGQILNQGQVLYQVNGAPVVLLYGQTPAYRALSEGTSTTLAGPDVEELNADLVALGYATSAEIPPGTDEFTYWTKAGVEKLQKALGVTQNGTLSLGQVVFEPTAVRVTSLSATLGAPAQAGQPVLSATSTTRQVSIALDADQQSEVAVGDKVTITLPDNETTPGVISSVGTVATTPAGGGSPTITVLVNPTDSAATGTWDQAPVDVTITTGSASNALVVPVDALLVPTSGGYALEVVSARGVHSLEPVSLGLFDDADGLVQVSGPGVAAGQRIVQPSL
jgi:hypothetical protein